MPKHMEVSTENGQREKPDSCWECHVAFDKETQTCKKGFVFGESTCISYTGLAIAVSELGDMLADADEECKNTDCKECEYNTECKEKKHA